MAATLLNIDHTTITLNKHINLTSLHINVKTQASVMCTSHVTAEYMPQTNMDTKLGIYFTDAENSLGLHSGSSHRYQLSEQEYFTHRTTTLTPTTNPDTTG